MHVTEINDNKTIRLYDIEPNVYYQPNLEFRTRYYQSLSDSKFLKSKNNTKEFPEYFSIWILPYDPFGDNRMIYTVKNMVVENTNLMYNDGVVRIFLFTEGEIGGTEEIRTLLRYFSHSNLINAVDSELELLHSIVNSVKCNQKAGERYMTMEELINYEKRDSYEEGRTKERQAGITAMLRTCLNHNFPESEIISILEQEYSLSAEEAQTYLRNF